MAQIIRPSIYAPFKGHPHGGFLRIDWSNPLTRGLAICYLPGIAGPVDLCHNTTALTLTANYSFGANAEGPALVSASASTTNGAKAALATNHLALADTNGLASVYWRGMFTAAQSGSNVFGVLNNLTTNNLLYIDSSATGRFLIASNSAGTSKVAGSNSVGTSSTKIQSYSGTLSRSGTTYTLKGFSNGVQDGSVTTWTTGAPTRTTQSVAIGGNPNANLTVGSSTNIALFWNRALSDSEIASLDEDPYQFIVPAMRPSVLSGSFPYNDTLAETATAADTSSATGVFDSTEAESVAAGDAPAATGVFASMDAESATAADSPSGALTTAPGLSEAASAADAESATRTLVGIDPETATAVDAPAGTLQISASDAESATAADTSSATGVLGASAAESASATDAASAGSIIKKVKQKYYKIKMK
jgi:hypothetical protein